MELSHLEAFERVVRDGNFTRAADALGLTQPAVSTRIALLEAELGGKLFERRGRRLHLTPLGERFLPYAERILAVIDESHQDVRAYHEGKQGQVKVAAPTPFLLGLLIDVLADFREAHPAIDILIRERNKTTILDLLHDNVITLGLVNAPVFDQNIQEIARYKDNIRAVVGVDHPLAQYTDKPLCMEDIYRHTIFRVSMFPRMTSFIDEAVENARLGSGGAVISVPMVMARRLVMLNEGLTFLPESYIKHSIEQGELVMLDIEDMPPLNTTPILIQLKSRQLDKVHLSFIETLDNRWGHLRVK